MGTADTYLSSLQWFRHNNFICIFCLLYTAPQLNICTELYLYTYRERRSQWIFLIQDRVTYIHRQSYLEGNTIAGVFLCVSTCIYAATESHNRKPADLFLQQHPIIHLLILPFSQVSQGVIAARKTSLLCEHTISFLPYKKALEPHGCTSVMEMGLCGRVWLIQNGLGEIMSLHKSPPGGSHL